ncbi:hypothetical protein OEZ85_000043 [Tetradesmus obliquus]|uniref:Uncharacterized protein n=1 Tax=Tetradesmus obliquus TaxID=3088 RepID=A0ABY8URI2_TETOB|nr:hypothetical protein OEZ85_000043 [Tetradesmus obliquus]
MQYNGPGSDWWNRDAYLDDIEALSNALAPPAHFASNVSVQALDVATGTSNFVYSRCNFSVSNLQAADAVRAQTIDVGTSLTCTSGLYQQQGIDLAELGYDLWNIFKKDQPWPEAMLQALQRVMDQVQEGGSNAGVTLKWERVKSRPVASGINLTSNRAFVGFNDDLLTSASCKLQVLPANRWTYDAQGTLSLKQVPGSAPATLIDFGSRDAWFNTVNAEALRLGSNCTILSGYPGFQLHNWVFSCNALMTASFNEDTRITFNSNSSVTISPNLTVDSNICAGAKVISPAFASPSNGSLAYNDLSAALSYNSSNFNSSRLEMFDDALEFSTQNIGQPAVQLQMSVDSNGSLYTRSNLTMPGTATIRATRTATLDAPYAEGLLRVTPDSLRFATSCNEQLGVTNEQLWMSMNSNGLFLLKNCAVFGRSEDIVYNDPVNPLLTLTRSAFPRLSATVSGGFRFGEGISNSSGQNQPQDYASISRQGVWSTLDTTSGMLVAHTNSNGCLVKGSTTIDQLGNINVQNRSVITSDGSIVRRVNPDVSTGFKVSPSGFVTIGATTVSIDGVLATACNLSAATVTEGGALLSNKYCLSNTTLPAVNAAQSTATFASNATVLCSNMCTAFSNYISPIAVNGSNSATALSNTLSNYTPLITYNALSNLVVPRTVWTSNALASLASTTSVATLSNSVFPVAAAGSNTSVWCSNALPALATMSNVSLLSNAAFSNIAAVNTCALWSSNQIPVVKTWATQSFKPSNAQVYWADVQGKPAFNTNNDGSFVSLALSGAALATSIGAAAMTVGGQNIMQYGADGMQLISNVAKNVAADLVNGVFKGFTRLVDADGTTLMEFTRNAQNQPLLNTSAIRSDRLQIGNASVHIDGASNALAISAPTSGTSNFFMGLAGGSNPSYWTKQWDMLTSTFQNYSPCNILVGNLTRAVKAVHVYGNGEQSMRFDVQGSVAQQLDVGSTGAAGVERTHFIKGMGTYPLVFGAGGGVERMRLTNTGNLGIGTSNPAFAIDCPNTARIGSMLIGDQGWGGGEWYGISHASCAGQNSYALLQRSDGYAVINSSNYLDLNVNNTPCVNITPTQVCALNKDLIVNNRGTEWILAPGLNQNTPDQTVCQYDVNQLSAASSTWHFFWDSMSVAGSFAASTKHFCIPHPLQPKDTCLVHACVESPRHELLYSGTARLVNGRAEVAIDSESCPDSKMRKGTFAALTEDARVLLQNNEGFTRVKGRVADGVLTIVAESQTCTDYIDWVVIAVRRASTLDDGPVIKNGRLKTEVPRGDVLLEESERPSRKRGKDQQPGGPPGNRK